jgi:hypothetical protein
LRSDQPRATVNHYGLARAVSLLHEEKIGARNLAGSGIAGGRPHKGWTLAASVCGAIVSLSPLNSPRYASMRFRLESCDPTFGRTCRSENETACTRV